jgi:gliding motility-associated-like protein
LLSIVNDTRFSSVSEFENKTGAVVLNDGELYLYSNYQNDGILDFTSGLNGSTYLVGTNVQLLSGSQPSNFNNLHFDNVFGGSGPLYSVSHIVNVANEAYFNNGIVDIVGPNGLFNFDENGFAQNQDNSSFINGYAYKTGTAGFRFPIGDLEHYRFCEITTPDLLQDKFAAKYFFSNPGSLYPISSKENSIETINANEYWRINRENGQSTVLVSLSWDSQTTMQALLNDDLTKLCVVRWDDSLGKWINEGGVVDIINKTVTTTTELDAYGVFTLGKVKNTTDLFVGEGVSPNGDNENDNLIVEGIENFPNTEITIFNRWGSLVYESDDYSNDWNGQSENKFNVGGDKLPEGTYFYILKLGGEKSNDSYGKIIKGYFYLKR